MGRPPECNCLCQKTPCDPDQDYNNNPYCWSNSRCLHYDYDGNFIGEDPRLTGNVIAKHDFIAIADLSYANGHKFQVWKDQGYLDITDIPADPEKSGSRIVIFTSGVSSARKVLKYLNRCENENFSGEIITFDKSILEGNVYSLEVRRIGDNQPLTSRIIKVIVFSTEENRIMATSTAGFVPVIECGSACFEKENEDSFDVMFSGIVKKDDVKRIYGLDNPEVGVHYCGYNEDGDIYTEKKLESGQISIDSSLSDIIFETQSDVVVQGEYIPCTRRLGNERSISRLVIQFNGDFSGTYPLLKEPYENICFGDKWIISIPSISISAIYTTWHYYLYPTGRICCSEITNFSVPYIGVARLVGTTPKTHPIDPEPSPSIHLDLYKAVGYEEVNFSDQCRPPIHQLTINLAPDRLTGTISSSDTCSNLYLGGPIFPQNSNSFYGGTAYRAGGIIIHSIGSESNSHNYSVPPFDSGIFPSEEYFYRPATHNTAYSTWNGCCSTIQPYPLDFKERLSCNINCRGESTTQNYIEGGPVTLHHDYQASGAFSVSYGIDLLTSN